MTMFEHLDRMAEELEEDIEDKLLSRIEELKTSMGECTRKCASIINTHYTEESRITLASVEDLTNCVLYLTWAACKFTDVIKQIESNKKTDDLK